MTRRALRRAALGALLPLALSGCFEAVELVQDVDKGEVQTGEAREVELRMLRLDVKDYRQTLSLADLKRLPKATLEELWLLDLEMLPLVTNTLLYLRAPCDGADAEIDCNDDHFDDPPLPDGLWSRLHLQLDPGTYFLFVEGYNGQTGRATISIDVNPLP